MVSLVKKIGSIFGLGQEVVPPLINDVFKLVLAKLERGDLARASQVCSSWNKFIKENDSLRVRLFTHIPAPLAEYLFKMEHIPVLEIKGKCVKTYAKFTDVKLTQVGTFLKPEIIYDLPVTPEMMSAPIMFVKEPWKRTAIAIRYHVSLPDGRGGDLVAVLHEVGKDSPGVWRCTQELSQSQNLDFKKVLPASYKTVRISTLFRRGWEKNAHQEFDYLKRFLEGNPCGPIHVIQPPDTPPVYIVCDPEEEPVITFLDH